MRESVLNKAWKVLAFLSAVMFFALLFVHLADRGAEDTDPGCILVKTMYEFQSPAELAANQLVLRDLVTEADYYQLCVDNELRTVNAYYKFGYSPSRVDIVEFARGFVLYRLENENIDRSDLWVLLYNVRGDGRLENVREYKLRNYFTGGEQT